MIIMNQSRKFNDIVIKESKNGKAIKEFDALDWFAQLATHIPNGGIRPMAEGKYSRFYSN